ncbi:hypothetical protein CcI156_13255 [Frankia sp. CcI156]|uniref:hypothetical protein n=1 Tax=Frankia TaxID=1854 RepID=UPI0006EB3C3D|nr:MULTISPECIES: hypothetical protein [Frankia]OFB39400.1 hypothetical protein Manayef4_04545 [Frankia sp. CgIM4]ONH25455.1 hypothetical protein CcI156_13255 [Frankia sp. CcI156]
MFVRTAAPSTPARSDVTPPFPQLCHPDRAIRDRATRDRATRDRAVGNPPGRVRHSHPAIITML